MQQKFTDTFCGRDFVAGLLVWLNVGVIEKRFAVLDPCEGVADIGLAGPDGFYFAAF